MHVNKSMIACHWLVIITDYATVQEALNQEINRLPDARHGVSPVPLYRVDSASLSENLDRIPELANQDSSSYSDLDPVFLHLLPKIPDPSCRRTSTRDESCDAVGMSSRVIILA